MLQALSNIISIKKILFFEKLGKKQLKVFQESLYLSILSTYIQYLQLMLKNIQNFVYRFSANKYFMDTQYKNVQAIAYDRPGQLALICNLFAKNNVNLSYLRTHCLDKKKNVENRYKMEISFNQSSSFNIQNLTAELKGHGIQLRDSPAIKIPWFPVTLADIDIIGHELLEVNESKEHSQFQDKQYVQRRDYIAKIAKQYKMGQPIPDIAYTQQENDLWYKIYSRLDVLHQSTMGSRFLKEKQLLNRELMITKRIPQLRQLSNYLEKRTGFTIKPTHGILSQRQFLNAFAFKIFCSTQYLRNVKNPDYTPEPDIVHEIIGHIPLFSDPDIAEISHKIGLLSLGASDQDVAKLGTLYWFTLEFGVCKEANKILGYGAGIASSIGQIEHMMSSEAKFKKLDIFNDCTAEYPVQTVQPLYRVTQSFEDSLVDLKLFGEQLMKPITTVYDEQKKSIKYDRNIQGIYSGDKGPKF